MRAAERPHKHEGGGLTRRAEILEQILICSKRFCSGDSLALGVVRSYRSVRRPPVIESYGAEGDAPRLGHQHQAKVPGAPEAFATHTK